MNRYFTVDGNPTFKIVQDIVMTLIFLIALGMTGCPYYNVFQQRMSGEAELARATYSKQVAVQVAQAKFDSAKLDAQSEIERSKGVAEANRIIGDSLKNNEQYLRYLFVNNLAETKNQVIYIPTEANLPILEASRGIK